MAWTWLAIARHQVFVVERALGDDAQFAQPLDDKAVPFIKRFGAVVPGEYRQFNAAQQQPVVRDIQQRLQQPRPDALSLTLAGDKEEDVPAMAQSSLADAQPCQPDDCALDLRLAFAFRRGAQTSPKTGFPSRSSSGPPG